MWKAFILTIQFLTRLPVNIRVDIEKDTQAKGTLFFPFVGLIIGAISGGAFYLVSYINMDAAALAGVIAMVIVTGGLHIDGLSDTADGFFSSRSRERVLEIMKDSRVGSFGVIAIVLDLLSKYVLIKGFTPGHGIIAIILACGCARAAVITIMTIGKTARPGGMGDAYTSSDTKKYVITGLVLFIIVGFIIARFQFVITFIIVIAFALLIMKYSYKVIGGLTGDVYGACSEISEIVGLLTFLAVKSWI